MNHITQIIMVSLCWLMSILPLPSPLARDEWRDLAKILNGETLPDTRANYLKKKFLSHLTDDDEWRDLAKILNGETLPDTRANYLKKKFLSHLTDDEVNEIVDDLERKEWNKLFSDATDDEKEKMLEEARSLKATQKKK